MNFKNILGRENFLPLVSAMRKLFNKVSSEKYRWNPLARVSRQMFGLTLILSLLLSSFCPPRLPSNFFEKFAVIVRSETCDRLWTIKELFSSHIVRYYMFEFFADYYSVQCKLLTNAISLFNMRPDIFETQYAPIKYFHCCAIKNKIKHHSVDEVKKLWYREDNQEDRSPRLKSVRCPKVEVLVEMFRANLYRA